MCKEWFTWFLTLKKEAWMSYTRALKGQSHVKNREGN